MNCSMQRQRESLVVGIRQKNEFVPRSRYEGGNYGNVSIIMCLYENLYNSVQSDISGCTLFF